MPDMAKPKHARLSAAWGLLKENPVLLAIAGIGFSVSFQTIAREASAQHMPGYPQLYPLLIDLGILGFTIESRKAIDDGRADLVPRALAWLLSLLTLYVNAHGSPARDWLGITLHVAAPCLWIAFLELTRWRKLRRKRAAGRIPAARWLLAPAATFALWRRMKLWQTDTYAEGLAIEKRRLRAVHSLTVWAKGKDWRTQVPGDLAWMLTEGIDMDEALTAVAALTTPKPGTPVSPQAPAVPRQNARQKRASASARSRAKAVAILAANPAMSYRDLAKQSGVSERTASRLKSEMPASLDEARQKRA